LIKIGSVIGSFDTVLIVIITGAVGAALAKTQGILVITQVKESLSRGELPAEEMVEGGLIFVGGIALLTPGLLTDITGLLLILPITRKNFAKYLTKHFSGKINNPSSGQVIIDVESEEQH